MICLIVFEVGMGVNGSIDKSVTECLEWHMREVGLLGLLVVFTL